MKQTILTTGGSTGIGKATAQLFRAKGWNVIATVPSPKTSPGSAGLRMYCSPG